MSAPVLDKAQDAAAAVAAAASYMRMLLLDELIALKPEYAPVLGFLWEIERTHRDDHATRGAIYDDTAAEAVKLGGDHALRCDEVS